MTDKSLTIKIDAELYRLLEQRAKKAMLDIDDLVTDILRRSMLSYKKKSSITDKFDDGLISIFSRRKKSKKGTSAVKKPEIKSLYDTPFKV